MESASLPQGIISSEQGNRTEAGEGGRCVFPSFFRSVFHPCPATFLSSGMFSCFSLPPSSSPPEDGFLSFSEKREKRKTAFRAGSPFSVFLLGKLSFSPLLRNASSCHPLRREKEKKEIAMPSEFFVRREEPPSFLLFPLEGRSRHFFQKRKKRKDGSIGIRHHGGRRFLSAEERKRKKKKRKKGILLSVGLPSLGKERREKADIFRISFSGSFFRFLKRREKERLLFS